MGGVKDGGDDLTELLGRPRADVLVVGCGNLIRGDDAAGPVLVRLLAEAGVPEHVRLVDGGTAGMDVAFAMRGARHVRIVDASRLGVASGSIHRVPGDELVDLAPPQGNLHRLRWDQALGFARWMLKSEYPDDVEVWLVEGESFDAGQPLTPAVQRAVEQLASRWHQEWTAPQESGVAVSDESSAQRPRPGYEEALGLSADVVDESGRFVVYLDVVLSSGAVRRRISEWPDRARAEVAARELVRQAGRHVGSPAEPRTGSVGST